ncbi:hypothetical protein AVEN_245709-1 [Araneus ventricosus]|uniref:Uncharacterized protein n=1 Tax=Araneus ventricosus TaxID=182803 RepID=A0A4Y2FQY5_ARAVE|nr:hypothetical protein AVEN_245709-1 [Araneus ventricosus]
MNPALVRMCKSGKIGKYQAFVISCASFVGFQLLLAVSLTIASRVKQCLSPFSSSFDPKAKKYYCTVARCRPLCSIREKNLRYYGVKTPSQCRSLCKETSCVCPPQRTTEKGPLMLGNRTCFLDQTAMGFCTLHRRVQIHTGERFRASSDLEGTTYQIPSIQHS